MTFKILSEKEVNNIRRRAPLMALIEELEKEGVSVDLTKYEKDTLPFLKQAILEHQALLPNAPPEADEPEEEEEEELPEEKEKCYGSFNEKGRTCPSDCKDVKDCSQEEDIETNLAEESNEESEEPDGKIFNDGETDGLEETIDEEESQSFYDDPVNAINDEPDEKSDEDHCGFCLFTGSIEAVDAHIKVVHPEPEDESAQTMCPFCDPDMDVQGKCDCIPIEPKKEEAEEEKTEKSPEKIQPVVKKPKKKLPYFIANRKKFKIMQTVTDEDFIRMVYMKYLKRNPDAGGLRGYLHDLKNKMPRNQLEAAIAGSKEAKIVRNKIKKYNS